MNAVIAIQDLIKNSEARLKALKSQLADYDSGAEKASPMTYASTENAIEQCKLSLEKHRAIYDELLKKDLQELEKEERIKEAIKRKNYYKYQKVRIKRSQKFDNNKKLEAMKIIDELPGDLNLEDEDIFDIATISIKLDLRVHDELEDELSEIKEVFNSYLGSLEENNISVLGDLHSYIPVLVLHLSILIRDIQESIENGDKDRCFRGLPRFQDWWINELWENHQAYFGLYRWKEVVAFLCSTDEQKEAWEIIFANWVFIKKLLNKKGEFAYEFNLAFDKVMEQYSGLEEEMEENNILSMDKIIMEITAKEEFRKHKYPHSHITEYHKFKRVRM